MKTGTKTLIIATTGIASMLAYNFYNKVEDLKNNVKFFIDGFRVHGIVNVLYLRTYTKVRIINQAQSALNIGDLQVFVQYIDGNKNTIDLGGSVASVNVGVNSNSTKSFELGTDMNLMSLPFSQMPGLLKGEKLTMLITSSFTAFGKRITIQTPQPLQLPAVAIAAINLLKPKN